jgi:hypothetical protein
MVLGKENSRHLRAKRNKASKHKPSGASKTVIFEKYGKSNANSKI